jgi:DNA polymerase
LSVRKNNQAEKQDPDGTVDPLSAAFLTFQVRAFLRFHQNMGIDAYPVGEAQTSFLKKNLQSPLPRVQKKTAASASVNMQSAAPSLSAIQQEIADCRICMLAEKRHGLVAGYGSKNPRLMVVGDWSRQNESFAEKIFFGPEEDIMLWRMMDAIGLSRADLYVTNVIKCCPTGVLPESICAGHCFTHLSREIAALKPGLVMAMGEMATAQLLGSSVPLVRLRGRFHSYRYPDSSPARVMPTFHPRFLLDNPQMKKMVWQDLQMVQRQLVR